MGLSSFKFEQWAPRDASFLRHSAFWPFKVIEGQGSLYKNKRVRGPYGANIEVSIAYKRKG